MENDKLRELAQGTTEIELLKHENKQMRLELQKIKAMQGSEIDTDSIIGALGAGSHDLSSPASGSIIDSKPISSN